MKYLAVLFLVFAVSVSVWAEEIEFSEDNLVFRGFPKYDCFIHGEGIPMLNLHTDYNDEYIVSYHCMFCWREYLDSVIGRVELSEED